MKKYCLIIMLALALWLPVNLVLAHGSHFNFGFNLGYPGFYGGYGGYGGYGFYDPFLYPPVYGFPPVIALPPVVVPSAPPVYIQQQQAPPVIQQTEHYWYYCRNPEGYYPYVKQCPDGWQRVDPRPPGQ